MSLKERVEEFKCEWLEDFLKEKLRDGDLKTYNRAKMVIYYFPRIINGLSRNSFELAIKHFDDTYICLGENDNQYRSNAFDKICKEKHGYEFEVPSFGEGRYVTIGDVFRYFNV